MKTRSAQGARLAAVDEDVSRRSTPEVLDTRRYDPLAEERWLRDQFRRERSAAYWFAASKWGFLGLIVGLCIGAFLMYAASISTMPVITEALARGAALEAAQNAAQTGAPPPVAPAP
jgi:hypothetical protein